MIGFAQIPKGARGQCTNTFSFTGTPGQVSSAINLKGQYSGNFDLQSNTGIESWSPCGGSTAILNMNTACDLSPTNLPALIAVSRVQRASPRFGSLPNPIYELTREQQKDSRQLIFVSFSNFRLITLAASSRSSSASSGDFADVRRQNCICDYWAVVAVEEIVLPLHRGLRNLDVVFLCRTGFSYLEIMSEMFLLSLLYSLASLGSQEIKMLDPRKINARMD